jgi:membrane protein implicated in regulation of membrane protease activity
MSRRLSYLIGLPAAVLVWTAMPAHAYLDPGTGSMILQVLLGGFAGLALAGKLYWRRFLEVIGVRTETPEDAEPADAPKARTDL